MCLFERKKIYLKTIRNKKTIIRPQYNIVYNQQK